MEKKLERNKIVDSIKMILKKHTINNQPNLSSDACREMIAEDIVNFIDNTQMSLDEHIKSKIETF